MRVEAAKFTSFVAVVCLFAMLFVSDDISVAVARLLLMVSNYRWCVIHSFANFGHEVALQVRLVSLSRIDRIKSLLRRFVKLTCFFTVALEEAFSGQSSECRPVLDRSPDYTSLFEAK